jgi:hypothetical protein
MKPITIILLTALTFLLSCEDPQGINNTVSSEIPSDHGILELQFIMPSYNIPDEKIHRISLNLSYDVEDLYRDVFFYNENVSDYQEIYKIILPEGSYYYDAVITCSCLGDTCLNGGFPGGQFGEKHSFDKFTIIDQETTVVKTVFQ